MTDMYRVRVTWAGLGQSLDLSTFYFRQESGTASQACIAAATFLDSMMGFVHTAATAVVSNQVSIIDDATGDLKGVTVGAPGTLEGLDTGSPLPLQTQGLVRWRTGIFLGGRQLQGKTYLPYPTTACMQDGDPNSAYRQEAAEAGVVLINDPNAQFLVWSRTNGVSVPVQSVEMSPEFGVLRGRR